MEPENKKPRTEVGAAKTGPAAVTTAATVYVRCGKLHRRGELVNDFFYAHRSALHMEDWYDPHTRLLYKDAPVEVVLVHTSKKPFFLVEWRHRTAQEGAQQKPHEQDSALNEESSGGQCDAGEKPGTLEATPAAAAVSSPNNALANISDDELAAYAGRLLALARDATTEAPLTFKGEPVMISIASDGTTVADARTKLHLRDLARQRVTEEEAKARAEVPKPTVTSFVPRAVRRRN